MVEMMTKHCGVLAFILSGCLGFPYMPERSNSQCGPPVQRTPQIIHLSSLPKHQEQRTEPEEELPYPDAKFPEHPGTVAASPDSDCFGLIDIDDVPGPIRVGTWAIVVFVDRNYSQFLYFNTRQDAFDCAGSEPANFAKMTKSGWVEVQR